MNNNLYYDVVIIGGGASGILTAIKIKSKFKQLSVAIVEGNDRIGKKLLLTGNGKCNLTNKNISPDNYITGNKAFLKTVLNQISYKELLRYFENFGLICKFDKEFRAYPFSEAASSVLDCFRLELERLKVDVITNSKIIDIHKKNKGFSVRTSDKKFFCNSLVIACGGKAAPKTGSDGYLFDVLFENFNLNIITPYPVLTGVNVFEEKILKALHGVRAKACVKLFINDKFINSRFGEVQFRKDAVSGICVFDLSKYVSEYLTFNTINRHNCLGTLKLVFDFFPDITIDHLFSIIKKRIKLYPECSIDNIFSSVINKKLSCEIIKASKIKPNTVCSTIPFDKLRTLVSNFKNFSLSPSDTDSFLSAQATAGGIDCKEINPLTMMSDKIKNLYAVGEVLDVAGDCGGYNLHFAFISALICAKNFKYKD
ncbi:MAG: aminoacetone oxidase family FAD-binding enzyme [Clostridia bacterium]|nr:aminoacetone oxidase family FAD-binding enzyme [Clostridia bacterium]